MFDTKQKTIHNSFALFSRQCSNSFPISFFPFCSFSHSLSHRLFRLLCFKYHTILTYFSRLSYKQYGNLNAQVITVDNSFKLGFYFLLIEFVFLAAYKCRSELSQSLISMVKIERYLFQRHIALGSIPFHLIFEMNGD